MTIWDGLSGTASVWRYGQQPSAHPPASRHGTPSPKHLGNMIRQPRPTDGVITQTAHPIESEPVRSSTWRNMPVPAGDAHHLPPPDQPHGRDKTKEPAGRSRPESSTLPII